MDVVVVLLAMLVLKLGSSIKELVKSAAHRKKTGGEAALIQARGEADYARARGKAEIIRARGELRSSTGATRIGGKSKRG